MDATSGKMKDSFLLDMSDAMIVPGELPNIIINAETYRRLTRPEQRRMSYREWKRSWRK